MTTHTHTQTDCLTLPSHVHRVIRQTVTYREHSDFLGKESELLIVEVVLEIDVNWS